MEHDVLTKKTKDAAEGAGAPTLRSRFLDLASQEMYENGFAGLRIDALIEKAGSTKGAFYHHFPSKTALGYAVVDEILANFADEIWGRRLAEFADPLEGIEASAQTAMETLGPRCKELGCPFNNLAQEMSAVDEGFRQRLSGLFDRIIANIAEALQRGQRNGYVRDDIDAVVTANFVFAALEGSLGLVKTMGAERAFDVSFRGLHDYLATLRR